MGHLVEKRNKKSIEKHNRLGIIPRHIKPFCLAIIMHFWTLYQNLLTSWRSSVDI